jgi:hypothetical protein
MRRWSPRTCRCGQRRPALVPRRAATVWPPGSARRRSPPTCRPG